MAVHFDPAQRELRLEVVYYGPALSGKTTNLLALHALAPKGRVGRLTQLESHDDRTLFFDLLPMFIRIGAGVKVKLRVITVPGQMIHDSTRRIMLRGADGLAFIADSQRTEDAANQAAFADLQSNITANGQRADLPMVVQFNKRDLTQIRSEEELDTFASRRPDNPVYPSVAVRGVGVIETLRGLLSLVWDDLDSQHDLGMRLHLGRTDFLDAIFDGWQTPHGIYG
jgi:hypothetical protein